MLLQNAGSETTRNLITTGTLALLERPDQLDSLRGDLVAAPDGDRGAAALQHAGDVVHPHGHQGHRDRRARRSREGDHVLIVYASANRDERAFDAARRRSTSPATPTTTSRSAPAARTSASARTSPGSRRKLMFEAILTRFEGLEVDGRPRRRSPASTRTSSTGSPRCRCAGRACAERRARQRPPAGACSQNRCQVSNTSGSWVVERVSPAPPTPAPCAGRVSASTMYQRWNFRRWKYQSPSTRT